MARPALLLPLLVLAAVPAPAEPVLLDLPENGCVRSGAGRVLEDKLSQLAPAHTADPATNAIPDPFLVAREYYATGEYDKARELMESVLKDDSGNEPALALLKRIREAERRYARPSYDALLRLEWFEADAGAAPAANVPRLREGTIVSPDPDTRAFATGATNELACVASRDNATGRASWGRPAFLMPVCKIWRAPVCKTESLRWNVTVAEPDTNGCSDVRVDATLSGNPDPAADSIQVRVEARAPLLAGEQLVVGPVPAGHVSTNANARAWLVVSWTRPAARSPAAEEPHAESAENTDPATP